MKNCRVCNEELTEANWMKSLMERNSAICKSCHLNKGRKWRKENRIKSNSYSSNAYLRNPEIHKLRSNKSRYKSRIDAIIAYGGKCNNCGITDFEVLDIDHIFNDGASDRKENLFAYNLYRKLKKEGYPKERHQLLCKNCNWKKELKRRNQDQIFKAINHYEQTK